MSPSIRVAGLLWQPILRGVVIHCLQGVAERHLGGIDDAAELKHQWLSLGKIIPTFPFKDIVKCRVCIKGNKNCYTGKVIAYGGYFYFAPYAAVNFLERELGLI